MIEIKSSFTTEKPIDYTQSKDAYDGTMNSDKPKQPESEQQKKKEK